jgi:hypothetical protein
MKTTRSKAAARHKASGRNKKARSTRTKKRAQRRKRRKNFWGKAAAALSAVGIAIREVADKVGLDTMFQVEEWARHKLTESGGDDDGGDAHDSDGHGDAGDSGDGGGGCDDAGW